MDTAETTHEIILARKLYVEEKFAEINKRLKRKKLPLLEWTWGQVSKDKKSGKDIIELVLLSGTPRYEGWTFVAALEHTKSGNIVRSLVDDLPAEYRERGSRCDHCARNRYRKNTYVVRNTDGTHYQVGSTCLKDFMGSNEADKVAFAASLYATAIEAPGESWDDGRGGISAVGLDSFLTVTAWAIRKFGWVPKSMEGPGWVPTSIIAWDCMTDPKVAQKLECDPIADDSELAHKAVEWAKSLTPDNDYLHNIHVIANNEWTDLKSIGFAASIISAYERAMGFERRKQARLDSRGQSNHVGEVGKRESWDVSLLFLSGYQTDWGYVKVVKFVDDSGNVFVWKSTSYTGLASDDIGKRFSVKGTVKAHNEYNGEKQTTLSRCKVVAIDLEASEQVG